MYMRARQMVGGHLTRCLPFALLIPLHSSPPALGSRRLPMMHGLRFQLGSANKESQQKARGQERGEEGSVQ